MGFLRSISGVRVSAEEELDVFHAGDEAVEPLPFVAEQRVGGDDDLPPGVPDAAADQAAAGAYAEQLAAQAEECAAGVRGAGAQAALGRRDVGTEQGKGSGI